MPVIQNLKIITKFPYFILKFLIMVMMATNHVAFSAVGSYKFYVNLLSQHIMYCAKC